MKKNTMFFQLVLALMLALLLVGCGQSQTTAQPPESERVDTPSSETTNTPINEQETQEVEDEETQSPTHPEETDIENPEEDSDAEDLGGSNEPTSDEPVTPTDNTQAPAGNPSASTDAPSAPVGDTSETTIPTANEPSVPQEQMPAANQNTDSAVNPNPAPVTSETTQEPESSPDETSSASNTTLSGTELTLEFGGGESFTIHLYDNTTAAKIAEYVGTADWRLPIYHYDDYDGWESFQYYDIPRRYDIPSNAETVTSEKAGMVYYSHPNRIILFYQDANISTEYTPIGYVDFSQDLVDAVENNPVVEGWSNKLIFIRP